MARRTRPGRKTQPRQHAAPAPLLESLEQRLLLSTTIFSDGLEGVFVASDLAIVDMTGTVRYEDLEFNTSGLLGNAWKAVRYAAVDLLNQAGDLLASTFTSATGAYSINGVTVPVGTQLKIRTKASTEAGHVEDNGGYIYEDLSSSIAVSSSTTYTLDRDILTANSSGAWNVLDMLVAGYQSALGWMSESAERADLALVTAIWDPGQFNGVCYDGDIHIGTDSDGGAGTMDYGFQDYDILHAYGHYVTEVSSTSDYPWWWESQHSFDQPCPGGGEMAWSEGFADFFSVAAAASSPECVSAVSVPNGMYVRVFPTGTARIDFEAGTVNGVAVARQADIETRVAAVLWDLYDTAADADDMYNQADGKAKLFTVYDTDLDGWIFDAPDVADLRSYWLGRWSADLATIDPIFRYHVPDIYTSTRFRDDYFAPKSAFAGTPIRLDAKLEEDTLGNFDIAGALIRFEIQIGGTWQPISDDGVSFSHLLTDSDGIGGVYYLLPESLPAGSYTYRAVYDGSGNYAGCMSSTQVLTVSAANATPYLVRSHTTGNGMPLVLVHGNGSEDRVQDGWWQFLSEMSDRAEYSLFDVYSFEHQTELAIGFNGTTGNAAQLADYIYDTILPAYPAGTKPILVAHSRGGLVSRAFMNYNDQGDDIAGLITLGTPHHGSPLAVPDWDAVSWASCVGSDWASEYAFDVMVSPDGGMFGWGPKFDTDRLGDIGLAWDNEDSAIGGPTTISDFDVIIATDDAVALTPRDVNSASAYADSTIWYSDAYKSAFGTLDAMNGNERYCDKIVTFAAFDNALSDNPDMATGLEFIVNLVGSVFSDHVGLSLVTDLLSEMHLGVVSNGVNYVANDGLVPIQSALLLDISGGMAFASIDDSEDVTLNWTNINARKQVKEQYVWTGTSADHLWLLDAAEDGYWDQITQEIMAFFNADSTAPQISSWSSAAIHGVLGEVLFAIPDDGTFSEPRGAGVRRLVVQFSEAIDAASFSPSSVQIAGHDGAGNPLDLSGITISTSTRNGDMEGVIDLSQALPNVAGYTVGITGVTDVAGNPLAGDNDRIITSMAGDATGDGRVDYLDLGVLASKYRHSVEAGDRVDFASDGVVDYLDLGVLASNYRRGIAGGEELARLGTPVLLSAGSNFSANSSGAEAVLATSGDEPASDGVDLLGLTETERLAVTDLRAQPAPRPGIAGSYPTPSGPDAAAASAAMARGMRSRVRPARRPLPLAVAPFIQDVLDLAMEHGVV